MLSKKGKNIFRGRSKDEPDSPGKPQVTDWDKDHVDLEWTPPKSDGGSPVAGYIIQKKEKGSPYWVNAASAPAGKTSMNQWQQSLVDKICGRAELVTQLKGEWTKIFAGIHMLKHHQGALLLCQMVCGGR